MSDPLPTSALRFVSLKDICTENLIDGAKWMDLLDEVHHTYGWDGGGKYFAPAVDIVVMLTLVLGKREVLKHIPPDVRWVLLDL